MSNGTTRRGAALALLVAGALAAAGCGGGSDDDAAATTTRAATTAPPATTASPTTAAATTTPPTATGEGDVAAGMAVFEAAPCAGCHAGLGTRAGFGPKLSDAGLTSAEIEAIIVEGGGQMPAGLVSGQELADVTAYVVSLQ